MRSYNVFCNFATSLNRVLKVIYLKSCHHQPWIGLLQLSWRGRMSNNTCIFIKEVSQRYSFFRNQGLKVDDDDVPSPENSPSQPSFKWHGVEQGTEICTWLYWWTRPTGVVDESHNFQVGWKPKNKSLIQIFEASSMGTLHSCHCCQQFHCPYWRMNTS